MSVAEYNLRAEDLGNVLIIVKQIGSKINAKTFAKVYDKIKEVQCLEVVESGFTRKIKFRYEEDYPSENNDWGDFQTHRKVLGVLSIGQCECEDNINELSEEHISLIDKYHNSVFDSRCLAFSNECAFLCEENDLSKSPYSDANGSPDSTHSPVVDTLKSDVFKGYVEPVPKSHIDEDDIIIFCSSPKADVNENFMDFIPVSNFSDHSSLQTQSNIESETEIENDSESNRDLNKPQSHGQSSPVFDSSSQQPCFKKIIIPSTVNSRNTTHCVFYFGSEIYGQLQHDVKEFLNSIFWILESKRLDKSFEKQDKVPLLVAPFETKKLVGVDTDTKIYRKRCFGRMKKHIGDLSLQAGLPSEAFNLYSLAIDYLKGSQDWLWLGAAYEGQCASTHILQQSDIQSSVENGCMKRTPQSKSLPLHLDPLECKNVGKSLLTFEEIADKYEEALMQYMKYQEAVILEMECCVKAARVYITHEKYLEATRILQNVVFTSLEQSDDEKVVRFSTLAQIFTEMGFHRKASFFKRIAAMRCVSATNPKQNWTKCYYLMIDSLRGYSLPLDVAEFPTNTPSGWSYLQIHMLFDICSISKMMNNQAISVRHLTFLLQTLVNHMALEQVQQLCQELEKLTAKCEGAPFPLQLENGITIPPVNLLNLPSVRSFKLQNLAPHLRPIKMTVNELKPVSETDSVFIFSPISRDRDKVTKEFKWVEGDVCEVALQVFNPLPFELKVTHIGILADDIAFQSFPACLSLPAESGPYPVTLLGTPLGSGNLQILGYTTHVMGIKSNCYLRDIQTISKPYFPIDVIPRLPLIQLSTSLPKASTFSSLEDSSYVVISATTTMYSGESQECTITITNNGSEVVEWLDLSIHSKLKKDVESSFFNWCKESLQQQMPISQGSSISFTLTINAISEFVNRQDGEKCHISSSSTNTPVRRKAPIVSSPEPFPAKVVEAVLQFQYSGGFGMHAKYCRQSAIAFTVEILPSIVITKWDVLPSEIPKHCYLVFDIQNTTSTEMEVVYALNKRILLEAHDICRVPVPVERCPLSVLSKSCRDFLPSFGICGHLWKYLDNKSDRKKDKLLAACSKHLESLVNLQWSLPALEIIGQASISEISWTDDMLGHILMSPIQWDIQVNGKMSIPEYEFNFLVGDLITLNIKLLNISEVPLVNLNLFVRGYQDHQNGRHNYRIETKRAIVGREKLHIDEIKPHEEYSHECGLIFFYSGLYKIDILCNHSDNSIMNSPNLSDLESYSLAYIKEESLKERKPKEVRIYQKSLHNDPCLIQKCSPTVAVSILED